jgi:predicted cupin superfamily sugar epimerase
MDPEKKSNGALIGSIIIIIILIVGGIYVWQSKVEPASEGTLQGEVVSPSYEEGLNSLEMEVNSANSDLEANAINSVE